MRRTSVLAAALAALIALAAAPPAPAQMPKLEPCAAKRRFDRMPLPSGTPIGMVAGHEFRKADVCVPIQMNMDWSDRYYNRFRDHSFYEMTAREAYPGEFWYRVDTEEFVIVATGSVYRGNDRLLSLVASGEFCNHDYGETCDMWTTFGTDDVVPTEIFGSKTGWFKYSYPTVLTHDEIIPHSVEIVGPDFDFRRSEDEYARPPAITIDNLALLDDAPLEYRELVNAATERREVSRTIRFDRNELTDEPGEHTGTLTMRIVFYPTCPSPFRIVAPEANARVTFSEDSPGTVTIGAEAGDFANMSPELIDEITWTAPEKAGATISYVPASRKGPQIMITYTGLPTSNDDFGPTTITASVDTGACGTLTATHNVRLFFPRDAKNNPGGQDPNWFYYWKQTPACPGPATRADPAGKCGTPENRVDGAMGYYRYKRLENQYYVCDLARHGLDNPFDTVQINAAEDGFDPAKTTGIDTFGVVCHHENGHYSHFRDNWFAHRAASPFSVAEDPNQNSIKDSVEAATDPDGDLVPTALELQKGLDPNDAHTIRSQFGFFNDDDEEYLAWIEEARFVIGSVNGRDWACPGKQCQ